MSAEHYIGDSYVLQSPGRAGGLVCAGRVAISGPLFCKKHCFASSPVPVDWGRRLEYLFCKNYLLGKWLVFLQGRACGAIQQNGTEYRTYVPVLYHFGFGPW